ncbi:unnamed protein product [Haemonchus placei]|uniref:Ovule protein n=1 Tax=Haemonchus placei TaxID=6290 RepID=A0A0N4X4T3_HAEPC|nr:unnamed protein product [Haemonchus placei]
MLRKYAADCEIHVGCAPASSQSYYLCRFDATSDIRFDANLLICLFFCGTLIDLDEDIYAVPKLRYFFNFVRLS